ncbi:MAG: glycosyltransferase family 4 protein [Nitrospirae bacterium]|nr:glycosyltransferase family 4 protein [Nitrospirota bacterium]
MKIVIDTIPLLSPLTGVGNYLYQIIRHLKIIDSANDYTYFYGYYSKKLFTYKENKNRFYNLKELVKKLPVGNVVTRNLKGIINFFLPKKFDLYFEPNFIPINITAKHTVVTIHDFSFKLNPEWHPRDRVIYFEANWKKVEKADKIIVVSDFIKDQCIDIFKLPEEKLKTIYNGFDREIFKTYMVEELQPLRDKYRLPERFILFVGSIEPRKNLKNMILAYLGLDKIIRRDLKLVIAGFKGWENREVMELLGKAGDDVMYIGYISDSELGKLYNLAALFAFPSFYEGFGLPPLEAMACGCPIIVSNVSSLPEVCGDAAYYVNPYDVESIADGIYKLSTDETLRYNLINKGIDRAKFFSWEKSSRQHLEVFEGMLNI